MGVIERGERMYEILSTVMKYAFILVIYYFIFGIIKLIYLDIRSTNYKGKPLNDAYSYIKLINQREQLSFKVDESYLLDQSKTLGRSSKNEIIIKDPYLSKNHLAFTVKNGFCSVFDMGSKNGTTVNGEKIGSKPHELNDGDLLHAGQLDFIFVERDGSNE